MILTETEAKAILEKVISYSTADETVAYLTGGSGALSRFANNAMTHNIDKRGFSLSVTVSFGQKEGSSTINKFDDESLRLGTIDKTRQSIERQGGPAFLVARKIEGRPQSPAAGLSHDGVVFQ